MMPESISTFLHLPAQDVVRKKGGRLVVRFIVMTNECESPTSLLTSSRSKFCSCSGFSRRRVKTNVRAWVRT